MTYFLRAFCDSLRSCGIESAGCGSEAGLTDRRGIRCVSASRRYDASLNALATTVAPLDWRSVSPKRKTQIRRQAHRQRARAILSSIADGTLDPYEGYRALYHLWCANNAAVPELRPLFRMPGIQPDGILSVTDEFRTEVRALAARISGEFQS